MAAVQLTSWQINPGKNQEFFGLVAEAKKHHERLGGKVRVWQAIFAGPNAGQVSYVIEHDDIAALGAFTQKLNADAEWQAFLAKILTASPAGTLLANSVANELTP